MNIFSIVLTTYNQEYEKIRITIDSILAQTLANIEIIVADDGSKTDCLREISNYLDRQGFDNYKTIKNIENVGTVRNALSGLLIASGDYAMLMSPGDFLADRQILERMERFLVNRRAHLASGNIRRYSCDDRGHFFTADYYMGDADQLKKRPDALLEQQLLYSRWVSGGSLFFEREYFVKYLKLLADKYNVRYCEDLVAPLITLNGGRLEAFEEQILWYEWGVGISNSGGIGNVRRMYNDYGNFYNGIMLDYNNSIIVRKAYYKFKIKELVSKITPLYMMLRRLLSFAGRDHMVALDSFDTEQEVFLAEIFGLM